MWYHKAMEGAETTCAAAELDSEHLCFILYTSGTTGKPKGVVHTTGGYLLWVPVPHEQICVFDLKDSGCALLVHRRHRLGDRAFLHCLWPAGQRQRR